MLIIAIGIGGITVSSSLKNIERTITVNTEMGLALSKALGYHVGIGNQSQINILSNSFFLQNKVFNFKVNNIGGELLYEDSYLTKESWFDELINEYCNTRCLIQLPIFQSSSIQSSNIENMPIAGHLTFRINLNEAVSNVLNSEFKYLIIIYALIILIALVMIGLERTLLAPLLKLSMDSSHGQAKLFKYIQILREHNSESSDDPGQSLNDSIEWILSYIKEIDLNVQKSINTSKKALFAGQRRMRRLMDATGEALIIIENGVVVDVNNGLYDVLGYGHADIHMKEISSVLGAAINNVIDGVQKSGKPNTLDLQANTHSGHLVDVEVLIQPYRDLSEIEPAAVTIAIHDISARKEAEAAISRLSQVKQDFLATMSHELRTPINGILGFSTLLLKAFPEHSKNREFLSNIQFSAVHLSSVVNNILDYSKLESGVVNLCEEDFDLCLIVNDVVSSHSVMAEEKGLSIFVTTDVNPIVIFSDKLKIETILFNLISNAVKFTKEGSINVDVHLHHIDTDNSYINIIIEDTGIGVPINRQDVIFEQFEQSDASITREYGGTGLGLSICKHTTDILGGSIEIESEPGVGSKFTVQVPVIISEDNDFVSEQKVLSEDFLNGTRILSVDDNKINRAFLYHLIADKGAIVDNAESGPEALTLLSKNKYDLVLMDIEMPEMSGISTLKEANRNGLLPNTPVVAVTANTYDAEQKNSLFECGFKGYILKPYTDDSLFKVIRDLLSKNKTSAMVNSNVSAVRALLDNSFKVDLEHGIERLVDAVEKQDIEETRRVAHEFAGAAGLLGYKELERLMRTIKDCEEIEDYPVMLSDVVSMASEIIDSDS